MFDGEYSVFSALLRLPFANTAWTVGPAAVRMARETPKFVNIQLISNPNRNP